MVKQITGLPSASSGDATDDDLLMMRDSGSGQDKNVSRANFLNQAISNSAVASGAAIDSTKLAGGTADMFGASVAYTPTITGYSSNPTNALYTYTRKGKFVTVQLASGTNGTSNSTAKTYSLPFAAKTATNALWSGFAQVVNNGAGDSSMGLITISSGGTTMSILRNAGSANWTSSGGARVAQGQITYEVA